MATKQPVDHSPPLARTKYFLIHRAALKRITGVFREIVSLRGVILQYWSPWCGWRQDPSLRSFLFGGEPGAVPVDRATAERALIMLGRGPHVWN